VAAVHVREGHQLGRRHDEGPRHVAALVLEASWLGDDAAIGKPQRVDERRERTIENGC
jgi:hypothetical protein